MGMAFNLLEGVDETDIAWPVLANNEAITNFINGKRHMAAYQFSKLIKRANSSDDISFNYAIVNLFTGCPDRACMIFAELVRLYPRNPRLWFRLAESMLMSRRAKMTEFDHVQANVEQQQQQLFRTTSVITEHNYPIQKNQHFKKKILIKVGANYHKCQRQQLTSSNDQQQQTPKAFLETVRGYLAKSLALINEYSDISLLTDDIPAPSAANPDQIANTRLLSQQLSFANPYQSINRAELYNLRNTVYINLAYVSLCMAEPVPAHQYTTQCLKSSPQGYQKVLAYLYHAEACILLDRIDEALQTLNADLLNLATSLAVTMQNTSNINQQISDVCSKLSATSLKTATCSTDNRDDDQRVSVKHLPKLPPSNVIVKQLKNQQRLLKEAVSKGTIRGEDMRRQLETNAPNTVLTYNLSVAYALRGEYDKASEMLLKSVNASKAQQPTPIQMTICLLYIQLQQGRLDSAKRIIQANLPQYR